MECCLGEARKSYLSAVIGFTQNMLDMTGAERTGVEMGRSFLYFQSMNLSSLHSSDSEDSFFQMNGLPVFHQKQDIIRLDVSTG